MANAGVWKMIIGGITTAVSILGAAYLAYRFALKRFREETPLLMQRDLQNKEIDILQNFWKLLQYTSNNENEKSIFIYEKKDNKKVWYLKPEKGKKFRQEISDFFYGQGAGLFVRKELKELLFEYDRQLFGLILSTKHASEELIQVKNENLINRLMEIHKKLLELLKKEKAEIMRR